MSDQAAEEPSAPRYCARCNVTYHTPLAPAVCPRCGGPPELFHNPQLSETILLRDSNLGGSDPGNVASARDRRPDQLIGKQLHVYRIELLLGSGGMGRVYLAHHDDLHRKCALKVLSPRTAEIDGEYLERFQHEGRAAASLIHPNVVTVHAVGEQDGCHFLEMEFVVGRSLQQLIIDEGQLTPERATALTAHIASGLAAAHRSGIVHRDLKPDNVLLTQHGVPKIVDFGLAKRIVVEDASIGERVVGTPNFMAPELFQDQPASPASDVYALGVCYFILLTGRFPFVTLSLSQLKQMVASDPIPDIRKLCPEIPLEMAECANVLLARSPANRPGDATDASQLLHAVLGQVRDIESLLKEAFAHTSGIEWTRCGSRYRLRLSLPEGRHQTVFVEPSDHPTRDRLLLFYSVCCTAQNEYYEEALRLNSEIPHGGLAIRNIDGQPKFVMVDTYPRSTVDAEDVRRSVLELGQRADQVEQALTGRDVN